MVLLARDEVQASVEEFDTDPWLFNVQDVTVDLRTGETHEHTHNGHDNKNRWHGL